MGLRRVLVPLALEGRWDERGVIVLVKQQCGLVIGAGNVNLQSVVRGLGRAAVCRGRWFG
jgi:hypothetical protein